MNAKLLINGDFCDAKAGRTFDRINPFDGTIASVSAAGTPEDAVKAVTTAQEAFLEWSKVGPHTRRKILLKAADCLEARVDDFIKINMAETGATGLWVGFNIGIAAKIIREAAALTTQISGQIIPSEKPDVLAMGVRQPAGVCLGIAPWNAAVILGVRAIAMPLACGNSVIFKASELSPQTHMLIGEVFKEAGLPPGVLNIITNAPEDAAEVVETIIRRPEVRRVNFTGSTRVGKIIASLCADELKPCLLELGGKAPFIVLDDAPLEDAVNGAAFGSYMNMGQICMSTEKIIVTENIADDFVNALAVKVSSLPAGDPQGPNVISALVDSNSADKVEELMQDALAKGAKLVAGGQRNGTVISAGLLDNVTSEMRIYHEETFGPVKAIIRVKDEDEAIDVANGTKYGLTSALYTSDVKKGLELAARIQSGICHVNGPTVSDEPQMPFGGVKSSGYGRFGGLASIAEFTDLRWITVENPGQQYPF